METDDDEYEDDGMDGGTGMEVEDEISDEEKFDVDRSKSAVYTHLVSSPECRKVFDDSCGLLLFVAHVFSSNFRCSKLCIFVLVTLCYVNRKKTLHHSHTSSNTHAPLHSFTHYHIHLPLPFSHTLYSHIAKVQTSLLTCWLLYFYLKPY